ncbi:MAG: hypothetical protein R2741_08465 [Methanolobus sp.]
MHDTNFYLSTTFGLMIFVFIASSITIISMPLISSNKEKNDNDLYFYLSISFAMMLMLYFISYGLFEINLIHINYSYFLVLILSKLLLLAFDDDMKNSHSGKPFYKPIFPVIYSMILLNAGFYWNFLAPLIILFLVAITALVAYFIKQKKTNYADARVNQLSFITISLLLFITL